MISATRGIDSTGIATVERRGKNGFRTEVYKQVSNTVSFLNSREFHGVCRGLHNPVAIMGHARAATLGAVNIHNAHPIEEGNTVLCHNGTIGHFLKNDKDEKDSDSRQLARIADDKGLIPAVKAAGIGALAVSCINTKAQMLSFTRNNQRPLNFIRSKAGHVFFWASEMWMLEAVRSRENWNFFDDPFTLKTDIIYSFDLASTRGQVVDVFEKPVITAPIKENKIFCRWCQKDRAYCHCNKEDKKATTEKLLPAPSKVQYQGWMGNLFSTQDIIQKLHKGCMNCKNAQSPASTVHWVSEHHFACAKCYDDDPLVHQYLSTLETYESSLVRPN